MPEWLTTLISFLCGSGLMTLIIKAVWDWQKRGIEKARKYDNTQRDEAMRAIIKEEVAPIQKDIKSVQESLKHNNDATIAELRGSMKRSLDECKAKGFATTTDRANWIELYNAYRDLGGNHFREYVNGWKTELENLPNRQGE